MIAPTLDAITGELAARTSKSFDAMGAIDAIQLLAASMIATPDDLLPHFVDLAMQLTGGGGSGMTMIDESDPRRIHWCYLRGVFGRFPEMTTERDAMVDRLSREGPVLFAHPERAYPWIAAAGIVIAEALVVPLLIEGHYGGALWVASEHQGHFDNGDVRILTELARFAGVALQVTRNQALLRRSLEDQEIIASEMTHRLKNVFALADGMVRATAKSVATPDVMADVLTGRLHALARAHSLVGRNVRQLDGRGPKVDLRALIIEITEGHEQPACARSPCFGLEGPAFSCGEHATSGIALLIHELATNAQKYGSLSRPGGTVSIHWTIEGTELLLLWAEDGGDEMEQEPGKPGFGSKLIDRTIKAQFDGTAERVWRAGGLELRMRLSLARLAA